MHPHLAHQLAIERQRDLIAHADRAPARVPRSRLGHRTLLGRRRVRITLLAAAALPAVLAAVALPAAAEASSAGLQSDGTLIYVDGARNDDHALSATVSGTRLVLTDNVPMGNQISGNPCTFPTDRSMSCPLADVRKLSVNFAGGDDVYVSNVDKPASVAGSFGNDTYIGGFANGSSQVDFGGGAGFDTVNYAAANAAVSVFKDASFNDGRSGRDNDRIGADVERMFGSGFADTLSGGSAELEHFEGGAGDDTLLGGGGTDIFRMGAAADGADDIFGGGGEDEIIYSQRTRPVTATLSDGGADDGEAGERDEIRQVERARGGSAGDTLSVHPDGTTPATLIGLGGDDTITGARGGDTLNGGPGIDTMTGDAGDDFFQARDGQRDTVGCGEGTDTALVENSLDLFGGCERFEQVGVLRLTPQAVRAEAGQPARLRVSWRHPQGWRKLDRVVLRVRHDDAAVGEVVMKPRGRRISADGAVRLVRRASRLGTRGKAATARLALRLDPSLAGERLDLEVEAVARNGRRQIERNAGTLHVN